MLRLLVIKTWLESNHMNMQLILSAFGQGIDCQCYFVRLEAFKGNLPRKSPN